MPNITQRLRDLFGTTTIHVNITPDENPIVDGLSARQLYATQANLHAVVSFLADSVAQLPLKVYKRQDENDRQRDRDSTAAKLLWRPNADQTSYEFIQATVTELMLMGVATIWLLPDADSESGYQIRLIPREWMKDTERSTSYAPDAIEVMTGTGGQYMRIPRTEFVQFRMYSPGNPGGYQSPIAALRQTLSEQVQADKFRTEVWKSSGRFNAYITRPANVQPWDDETRKRFATAFRESWGRGGSNAGKMPILEDGMEIKPYQFNSKEAQYAETKQLSREDVAAAYHINPSLIWHTTTQTYASAKDNARALYADCLGPTIQMLQQRINSFLLPMIGADAGTYVEFDLREKLKGSFEERAAILQSAVGGPWMTRDEARADNNMPPLPNGQGQSIITPLNVTEGGQASPTDTHMDPQVPSTITSLVPITSEEDDDEIEDNACNPDRRKPKSKACNPDRHKPDGKAEALHIKGKSSKEEDQLMSDALKKFFKRQRASVIPKIGAKATSWWDDKRWNEELADDLEPIIDQISDTHGKDAADQLGTKYEPKLTGAYLRKLSEGRATVINESTKLKLQEAIKLRTQKDQQPKVKAEDDSEDDEDETNPVETVFDTRENRDADSFGRSVATAVASWGLLEACKQAKDQGYQKTVEKMWVTGDNARSSHAAMNGETVPIDETFSNGAYWPGDDNLDPDESCGCNCSTEIIITEE